ncbi:AFR053Cp [Eremothecium gossypii ATCC 10895]|uniref:AFR053Cp n=1 Tax=Eremothecium gossypii (strain ATCC 10895 / CBS 109.51 / FGSC 9923 / NRRL Y-1056) TaxID=284811 RepID=Q754L9_EREGS|nr:AFR053Cp [Eremothecium gossypii ATCC 10895]AAS53424.2 AFR053Cp [Eremothecium gossypii ATCC 10895]AEY97736.1 FAFR053Cp [Eremothecium gossypii FDAG1]
MNDSEKPRHDQHGQQPKRKFEGPKREAILDLAKYQDTQVRVKLMGGRLVTGVLKGYDQLMNLVLDETVEYLRDEEDASVVTQRTRPLGLIVIRGTILLSLSPAAGGAVVPGPAAE